MKRTHFAIKIRRIPFERLVFLDESGLNLSMSRSHAWVKRGKDLIDRVPMNWGKNLTLLGAMRRDGWVVLTSTYEKARKERFVCWLKTKLLPKLRRGDIIVMDNLAAHQDPRVLDLCALRGVEVIYLPPYSPDFNPIESAWALQKQFVRRHGDRRRDVGKAWPATHVVSSRSTASETPYRANHRGSRADVHLANNLREGNSLESAGPAKAGRSRRL